MLRSMKTGFVVASVLAVLAGLPAQTQPKEAAATPAPDEVGARVGAIELRRSDFLAETDRQLPFRFHSRPGSKEMLAAQKTALALLIEKALVFQDAEARGISASDAEIAAEFDRTLQKAGAEFAKLDADGRSKLLAEHRPQVVRRVLLDKNEARFRASLPAIDAEAMRVRYESRRSEMVTPARAHFLHLLVKVAPEAPQLEVDRLLAKARQARADLLAGKTFAEVAKANSDDIYAQQGGDLGWIERGAMRYREIESALFALQPGQTSEVLNSMYGFHVATCVAMDAPRQLSFDEAEPLLRERMAAEQIDAARKRWHEELRQAFPVTILIDEWRALQ